MERVTLSPNKAAKRANVSRGTVMNWINSGKLKGFRDNKNNWQVDLESLLEITDKNDSNYQPQDSNNGMSKVAELQSENSALKARIEVTEARLQDAKAALERAEARADSERARADRQAEAAAQERKSLTNTLKDLAQPQPGLLARLFGKG